MTEAYQTKIIFFIFFIGHICCSFAARGQEDARQHIRGRVKSRILQSPLRGATIKISGPSTRTVFSDENGNFEINDIPAGGYAVSTSRVGYVSTEQLELVNNSAKDSYIEIYLDEQLKQLQEVHVFYKGNYVSPNPMVLSGANHLTPEKASRFAGSMDDPARMVTAFAGVSSGVSTNSIAVRGNAPNMLLWRLEGIEIENPNHFANISSLGGGVLSSLSGHVLGSSEFLVSAFPANYNNAVAGVFDMKFRNGNTKRQQYTFQAGILGLDLAAEGPIKAFSGGSYLMNYRYSSTGLANKLKSKNKLDQILDYQDLNFKVTIPTTKFGEISLWGTALKDHFSSDLVAADRWKYRDDSKYSEMKQLSAALGLSQRINIRENAYLRNTISKVMSRTEAFEDILSFSMAHRPYLNFKNSNDNLVISSSYNRKFSAKHSNMTGVTVTRKSFDIDFDMAPSFLAPPEQISASKGSTTLLSAYSSSLFHFNDRLSGTAGVNIQFLSLNNDKSLEPRLSLRWMKSAQSIFTAGYGLNSRMSTMDLYFVKSSKEEKSTPNRDLGFLKSHHVNVSYERKLSHGRRFQIEPYVQFLYHVPVIPDSSYSIVNRSDFYVKDLFKNEGKGINLGVDFTYEQSLRDGFYYLFTATLFSSRYRGGDNIWYNTRFNRTFVTNFLVGKEWFIGQDKRDVLAVNLKLVFQGGERYSPVDFSATMKHPEKDVIYDNQQAFSKQLPAMPLVNYGVSYRMNRGKVSHEWALKGLNANGYKEYYGHQYNFTTGLVDAIRRKSSVFNIYYRFDF